VLFPLSNVLQIEFNILAIKALGYKPFTYIGYFLALAYITLFVKETGLGLSKLCTAHYFTL